MKKIITLIAAVCISFSAFAYQNFFSPSIGLSSGIPFYGTSAVNDWNRSLNKENRFIIGALGALNFNVSENATFFLGSDLLCDFMWDGSDHSNHLSYDFSLGVKIFPNLAGFCAGLAYVTGARTDFVETKQYNEFSYNSAWGNGVKLLAEYNFAHEGKSKYYPTVGMYWKILPRGNNDFDNMICAYIMANF